MPSLHISSSLKIKLLHWKSSFNLCYLRNLWYPYFDHPLEVKDLSLMENSSKYINSKSFCSSKCINFAHFASSFIDSLLQVFCTILYLFLYLMLSEFFMANLTMFQLRWGMSSKFSSNFSLNLCNGKMLCSMWLNKLLDIWNMMIL